MTSFPSGLVTLLFTDIEGSTRTWEAHPELMKSVLARHDEIMRGEIEAARGYVFKTVGDAFCATFQSAPAALAAAVSIQRSLAAEDWPDPISSIRVRMSLHSGECEERGGDYFGPAVNRAARLEATAHGGQLVISGVTAELVRHQLPPDLSLRDMGEHRLKDLGRPERVFQVCGEGLGRDFPPLRSLDNAAMQHNLPEQTSSFVGREREVAEVAALLGEARLVTLAGPGGVGKTRLALQAAAERLDGTGDGVWFVDLAPVTDATLVPAAVAKVLWVREQGSQSLTETIVESIRDKRLLVVMDNCEQVIYAAAVLAETLVRKCPGVNVLITSREPLGVAGERVYRVQPLSVPAADDLETVAASEAVGLFVERARHHKPGFTVDEANAATVGRLCRRLDGIPFAIELAAARLRSMSVADIDSHLDKRFRVLTGGSRTALPRQQTLQALIDWSYNLLSRMSPAEQEVLARLSIFAGGFDMVAAEAVVAGGDVDEFDVLGILDALVDKSLVQADESGATVRYRLLESTRDYAAARMAERDVDEQAALARAHRDHYLAVAEEAWAHLRGPGQLEWADRLDLELDNLRAALAECLRDPDPGPGLHLADLLSGFWFLRGYGVEGTEALRAQLARPEAAPPTILRGRALAATATLVQHYLYDHAAVRILADEALGIARAEGDTVLELRVFDLQVLTLYQQGDCRGCLDLADSALALARGVGDLYYEARLLNVRGGALYGLGEDGRASFEESAALYRRAGDRRGAASAMSNVGLFALEAGQLDEARALMGEALRVKREQGDRQGVANACNNAGYAAYLDGDDVAAYDLFDEGLAMSRRIGARPDLALAILGLAAVAARAGEAERAATLHGAFDELFFAQLDQSEEALEAMEAGVRHADLARLRTALGDARFESATRAGRALPLDQVITLARQPRAVPPA
ncbi:MAG: hypothetical protein QOH36_893 [Actinomycetota bacterium]|nr:hypothetical protein [Actinomycetota bacterium]